MNRFLIIIIAVLFSFPLQAQKVGLVLSGGGAKGIAHIGVIKVLEDNDIPIDYITGTSMGAIVAGLYAMGFTPDEMLVLFKSDDFALWSKGKLGKDDLYYFRRSDELPELARFDISRKNNSVKLDLPLNLIPEQQMDFAFLELTAQSTAACRNDFNNLMIPFRCVSTDIYENKAVVHADGDLGEAIRASMTFPLVYKPIEKDGRLLFDGGIVNNFPVDVMMEDFNPDIVIGHTVTNMGGNTNPDDLFGQIEAIVTQTTNYEVPDSIGVLMETQLDDVGLFDFPQTDYINSRGIETGLNFIDSIKTIIERRTAKQTVNQRRVAFGKRKPELKFNNIQVEGVRDNLQRKYIIQSIKYKEKVIDMEHLRSSYFKLIADEHIKSIRPIAYYNRKTGLFDLHLKVTTSKPLDVAFGGHISTRANTFGFLQANLKAFNQQSYNVYTNLYFGKFYNSLSVMGRMDSPNRIPYYISGGWTINYWDYLSTSTDIIFTDVTPSYIKQGETNLRLEFGLPYSKTGIIDVEFASSNSSDQYFQTTQIKQGDEYDETNFSAISGHIRVDKKNYDYKQYPTAGERKLFKLNYVNGDETFKPGTTSEIQRDTSIHHSYFQVKGLFDEYHALGKYFTVGTYAEAAFNNNSLFNNYTASHMNAMAFAPTPNSKSLYLGDYRANQYFALGGKAIYKVNDLMHLRAEVYGFFPIQQIMKGEKNIAFYHHETFTTAKIMALGAMVVQTGVGPLSVEMNYYDRPGQKWFFSVNMGFMMFNNRAF